MQAARDTRPIRGQQRLFFVNGLRNEGWAFYLEEFLIQSGMLEDRPKAREIDYILGAKRAARILPELKMQANEWTWQQANASLVSRKRICCLSCYECNSHQSKAPLFKIFSFLISTLEVLVPLTRLE